MLELSAKRRRKVFALPARALNVAEQDLCGVQSLEDQRYQLGGHGPFALAHLAQDVFRKMRHGAEYVEAKKTACPFDRMNSSKGARDEIRVVRVLFKRQDVDVQGGQVLVAFDQELSNLCFQLHCSLTP